MYQSMVKRVLLALCVSIMCGLPLLAQFRASVRGTITDPSGAILRGVRVMVTNQQTGVTRTTVTNGTGYYAVAGLPPGRYQVTARLAQFKPEQEVIVVHTDEPTGANLVLQPGTITQAVTVTAQAPLLQTQSGNLSQNISGQNITSLPVYSRDPYETLNLIPGIFGDNARAGNGNTIGLPNSTGPGESNLGIFQTENQIAISSAGQRMSDNNYMVDGVTVNSFAWGGATVVTPNEASIQSMHVVTNGYSARYGRNSGAQIDIITKQGTNKIHGSADYTYQSPGLNAFNSWGGPNGAKPVRVDNAFRQFAGSLGGPIIKNHAFYFFSYEGLRDNTTSFANSYVFTPQFISALTAARPGTIAAKILSQPSAKPNVVGLLTSQCADVAPNPCQAVPGGLNLGSITGSNGQYVDNFSNSNGGGFNGVPDVQLATIGLPGSQSGNQYNARFDYDRRRNNFALSTYITSLNQTSADANSGGAPMGTVNLSPLNSTGTLMWTHIVSPTVINQMRANFTRFAYNQLNTNPNVNWGLPTLQIQGFAFGRLETGPPYGEYTPGVLAENTFAYSDTLSQVLGNQSLKYGVYLEHDQSNNSALGNARPIYVFQGLWNLANSAPIYEGITANPVTGTPTPNTEYFRENDDAAFIQDDWQLRPNLTVTLGLRWEYFSPLKSAHGLISNLFFGSQGLSNAQLRPVNALYTSSAMNFEPRVGFAYSPGFLSNTVLHGGFGIFDNRFPEASFDPARQNPPFFANYGICCGTKSSPYVNGQILYAMGTSNSPTSYPVNPALAVPIDPRTGSTYGVATQVYGTQPKMPTNYVEEWSLDLQHEFPGNWVSDVAYQGSAGRHFIRLVNQNYLYPNTVVNDNGAPFNPFYAAYFSMPDANSSFNALVASLHRTFANGFTVEANYRWSKSLDVVSYEGPGFVTNEIWPQNWKLDYGPSDYNAAQDFTLWGVYTLPFISPNDGLLGAALGGWQIGGVLTAHSGFPWTPVSGQSVVTPGGPSLSPTAPIAYYGGNLTNYSNQQFMTKGGDFPGGAAKYFNFTKPGPPGVGRNSFTGPHFFQTDMNLAKNFHTPWFGNENSTLGIRVDAFNIFNTLNLVPFGFDSSSTNVQSSTFGMASGALAGRVVQLQANLTF